MAAPANMTNDKILNTHIIDLETHKEQDVTTYQQLVQFIILQTCNLFITKQLTDYQSQIGSMKHGEELIILNRFKVVV